VNVRIKFHEKGKKNGICTVISKLVERKKNLKEIGDIYYGMEFVTGEELKYVLLKMCTFFHIYLCTLKKSFEI